ncbi:MAG TPA: tetratricopeptide repeat protein [Bauldia sp.]
MTCFVRSGALLGACVAVLALCAYAMPGARAAEVTAADQKVLLVKALKHPDDYQTVFEYVRVSEELHDYEAAIGALERLLFYNPKLTRVKYELATLYYRSGSYQMAVDYFKKTLASPDLDADTRSRIDAYLPLAEKENSPVRTWLFLQAGIRYQSNASFTPSSGMVLDSGSGFPVPLDLSQPHGADWNAFALGLFANDIDFGNAPGDRFETRVTGYATNQFALPSLNVGLLSGSFGPRLALAPITWPGLTIKPYVVGSAIWVAGAPYTTEGGGGVTLSAPFGKMLTITPYIEWQRADYSNGDPANQLGTADMLTAAASAALKLGDAVTLNGGFSYQRSTADMPDQSNTQYSEQFSVAFRFDPPFAHIAQKWTLTPFVGFTQTAFDIPNPAVDPGVTRSDTSWQAGVAFDTPLTAHFGVAGALTYQNTASNIINYSFDDWSAIIGPTLRF